MNSQKLITISINYLRLMSMNQNKKILKFFKRKISAKNKMLNDVSIIYKCIYKLG